jgi:restriction system protein
MPEKEAPVVWGIHAGHGGEADSFFLKHNLIAVGWPEVGDLGKLKADQDSFKKRLQEVLPTAKAGAIRNWAGILWRFTYEMKKGDVVVYPSKIDRQVHIGIVAGPYLFEPGENTLYPHQRAVQWKTAPPRTKFSQGALYEIGSALTFFQVRNFAEEFLAALSGKPTQAKEEEDAKETALIAEQIEQTTRDFILKRLTQELKGHPLAEFVAHLLGTMGYRCHVSEPGPDQGVDIIAHHDELGFEPPIIKVQVKSTDGNIGDPTVSALYGKVGEKEFGLLVTLGKFTNQAKNFAQSKSNLRLIDGDELLDLILVHYEQFDSSYKGLLPLKRVYIPQPLEEED